MRIGVDVGMYFHVNIIGIEKVAKLISNFNAFCNFNKHALLDTVLGSCFLVVDEHKAAVPFAKENNYRCKFCFRALHLRVCTDAYFQVIAFLSFPFDGLLNRLYDGQFNRVAVKFSP
jgi:hypothetical protein